MSSFPDSALASQALSPTPLLATVGAATTGTTSSVAGQQGYAFLFLDSSFLALVPGSNMDIPRKQLKRLLGVTWLRNVLLEASTLRLQGPQESLCGCETWYF